MRQVLFLFVLLLCGALPTGAQPLVRALVDSPRAFVGSPVTLRLQAGDLPAGSRITFPKLGDKLGELEVVSQSGIDTLQTTGSVTLEQEITLLGFDSGLFTIPAQSFTLAGGAVSTEPAFIYYTPLPVDTAAPIRPIRDIVAAPPFKFGWLKWVLLGLGGLLLIVLIVWIWKKYKKSRPLYKQRPVVNTAEALRSLGEANLATQPFYTQLAQIMRDALGQKWETPVRRQTTAQTLAQGRSQLKPEALSLLQTLLTEADAVKFARQERSEAEKQGALSGALELVQKAELP
jgi:hypothetical protein